MNKPTNQLCFYRGKQLATSRKGADSISLLSGRGVPLAQVDQKDNAVMANLYGVDALNTIHSDRQESSKNYTAFGFAHRPAPPSMLLGFTGQYWQCSGFYLLGRGHRAYSPMLMRFCSADRLSPFGKGGINPYVYCGGDPVNYSDPSGQFKVWRSFKKWLTRLTGLSSKAKAYQKGYGTAEGVARARAKGIAEKHSKDLGEERAKSFIAGHGVGYAEGHEKGHAVGYKEGHAKGYDTGASEGRGLGYIHGHESGFNTATNGDPAWQEWRMYAEYGDITNHEALVNLRECRSPYIPAKHYGTVIDMMLKQVYRQGFGIRGGWTQQEVSNHLRSELGIEFSQYWDS